MLGFIDRIFVSIRFFEVPIASNKDRIREVTQLFWLVNDYTLNCFDLFFSRFNSLTNLFRSTFGAPVGVTSPPPRSLDPGVFLGLP